jgi:hypothetical protein
MQFVSEEPEFADIRDDVKDLMNASQSGMAAAVADMIDGLPAKVRPALAELQQLPAILTRTNRGLYQALSTMSQIGANILAAEQAAAAAAAGGELPHLDRAEPVAAAAPAKANVLPFVTTRPARA